MKNSRDLATFLFLLGATLLVIMATILYFGIPSYVSKSEIEGWNSYDSVGRFILGPLACFLMGILSVIAIIGGMENRLQRVILPPWLSMWEEPVAEPTTLRERIISLVAKALGVSVEEVDENTEVTNLYEITPYIVAMTGESVYGKDGMTLGELLEQVT